MPSRRAPTPSGPRTCWKSASGPEGSPGGGVGVGVGASAVVVLGAGLSVAPVPGAAPGRSVPQPAATSTAARSKGISRRTQVGPAAPGKGCQQPSAENSHIASTTAGGALGEQVYGVLVVPQFGAAVIADLVDEQRVSDPDHQVDVRRAGVSEAASMYRSTYAKDSSPASDTSMCGSMASSGPITASVGGHSATADCTVRRALCALRGRRRTSRACSCSVPLVALAPGFEPERAQRVHGRVEALRRASRRSGRRSRSR